MSVQEPETELQKKARQTQQVIQRELMLKFLVAETPSNYEWRDSEKVCLVTFSKGNVIAVEYTNSVTILRNDIVALQRAT
jgi:hypothetical protein